MTTFDWATTRDHAISLYRGDHPGAALEESILHHFEREPQRVIDTIDQIGRSIERGGPNAPVSGWAVLAKNLATQPLDRQVSDNAERTKQLRLAETWIRNTGGNIDRQTELISELYDPDLGRLRHWPDTQPQIIALWTEQRPRFETMEAQATERMAHQAATLKRLRKASRGALTHESADAHAERVMAEIERARLAWQESLDPGPDA